MTQRKSFGADLNSSCHFVNIEFMIIFNVKSIVLLAFIEVKENDRWTICPDFSTKEISQDFSPVT